MKKLFMMITMISSLQAAASPSYWDRFTSWLGSTAPSQYIPSAATYSALGSKLNENRLPTAVAGLGLLGLGYGAYRYAQGKPIDATQTANESASAQAKQAITAAILNRDRKALQAAITKAFDARNPENNLPTTPEMKREILAYALAEYKKHPETMHEYKDFMLAVYNPSAKARGELLNSEDSPLELRALWRTVTSIRRPITDTNFPLYHNTYNARKRELESEKKPLVLPYFLSAIG